MFSGFTKYAQVLGVSVMALGVLGYLVSQCLSHAGDHEQLVYKEPARAISLYNSAYWTCVIGAFVFASGLVFFVIGKCYSDETGCVASSAKTVQ